MPDAMENNPCCEVVGDYEELERCLDVTPGLCVQLVCFQEDGSHVTAGVCNL